MSSPDFVNMAPEGYVDEEAATRSAADNALGSRLDVVESKIPTDASSSNKLADKAHVAAAIAAVKNSRFAVVEELPASGEENVIYLVPAEDGAGDDVFDEYIWLVGSGGVGAWEKIASTRIDLSGYATTAGVNVLLSGKVDKEVGKGLSSNDYTTTEKMKLAAAATSADVAPCLTRAEAVDGYTKWEVEAIASGKSFVGCEWHEGTAPNRGWVVSLMAAGQPASFLIPGEPDDTSLVSESITLSRVRIHPAIDAALSPTSENPVQNKAVAAAVDGKLNGEAVYPVWGEAIPYGDVGTIVSWNGRFWRNNAQTIGDEPRASSAYWDEVFLKDVKANAYDFSAIDTISSAGTEQSPNEVTPVDAQNKRVSVEATNAYIAVAMPAASANGHIRDFMLTLDCSSLTEGDEPTVTWGTAFHPRTDAGTDFACAAGVRNVYYISEYATGEFVVGGWQETEGGNA